MPALDWTDLPRLFPEIQGTGRWLALLQRHARLVDDSAARVRVSAVSAEEAVGRQYAESLEFLRIAEFAGTPEMLIDVGSGGGFPGIVVAVARPSMAVHLVEPLKKRAKFLAEAVTILGLRNVTIHAERAEESGRGPLRDAAPFVSARAVAGLSELLEYTAPLAAPGALIALPKGSSAAEELVGSQRAVLALNCEVIGVEPMRPEISENITVVLLRKLGPTPARFPRRPGVPAKRPL